MKNLIALLLASLIVTGCAGITKGANTWKQLPPIPHRR
jgi:hypothetical protein